MNNQGTLYIVATPIGNLDDISQRAISTLKKVDVIACEDTRHSQRMLAAYGIKNKLISHHQFNEKDSSTEIVKLLREGQNFALISDAGTPLISDPGFTLVQKCHEQSIEVIPIPGACAIIALLSSSGLPTSEFQFIGFLPTKSQARISKFNEIQNSSSTTVFYESTHRIKKSLADLEQVVGSERRIAMGRELSKAFETIKLATVSELIEFIENDSNQTKGEFVLALAGKEKVKATSINSEHLKLAKALSAELPPKKASKIVAQHYGVKSKEIYNQLIQDD